MDPPLGFMLSLVIAAVVATVLKRMNIMPIAGHIIAGLLLLATAIGFGWLGNYGGISFSLRREHPNTAPRGLHSHSQLKL